MGHAQSGSSNAHGYNAGQSTAMAGQSGMSAASGHNAMNSASAGKAVIKNNVSN